MGLMMKYLLLWKNSKKVRLKQIINSLKFMRTLKEKLSITLDNDIVEKLKIEAKNDDRSLSRYINIILKKYIKMLDSKEGVE